MSGRKARAARQAEYAMGGKSKRDMREENKQKASRKTFWIVLASCLVVALVVAAVVVNRISSAPKTFAFSEGIAENGFWKGVTALDYVELFDYLPFSVPQEVHEISDAALRSSIDTLLGDYSPEMRQVTDREVLFGDTVNIDYVGSIDGVPFEGGSTEGEGADVSAGGEDYIDDFLTQIIGHNPGETFDVEVTFPEYYGNEELDGKDAVFVTTINYIIEKDITDSFVEENLFDEFGWKTVAEMEESKREELKKTAIENYVNTWLSTGATLSDTPSGVATYRDKLAAFQEKELLAYYQGLAESYEMDLETLLQIYMGLSGTEELAEQSRNEIYSDIQHSLTVQAIAEDAGISVADEDMERYLPAYTSYVESYGMPWLRQYVLGRKVLDFIIENAELA